MRRNNVVIHKHNRGFYGRIIRMLPDNKVFWLCSGLHFHITNKEDLELVNYKGYTDLYTGRFIPMTSIRTLKKRAKQYHGKYAHKTPLDYIHITHD